MGSTIGGNGDMLCQSLCRCPGGRSLQKLLIFKKAFRTFKMTSNRNYNFLLKINSAPLSSGNRFYLYICFLLFLSLLFFFTFLLFFFFDHFPSIVCAHFLPLSPSLSPSFNLLGRQKQRGAFACTAHLFLWEWSTPGLWHPC